MRKTLLTTSIALASLTLYGQGGVAINPTGNNPTPSAMLDVTSNSKGILIPRIPLTSTTDATTISNGNVVSLLIYNTATVSDVTPGFYYWNGNNWKNLGGDADADPTNEIEIPIGGANGQVLSTDGSGNYTWINDNQGTDNQNIQNLSFDNLTNMLTVGIQNGNNQTLDLTDLINDADADVNNELQDLSLTGVKLALTSSNDTVDFSPFLNHNWYKENTTTQATSIAESIYTNGKIGIGKINPLFSIDSDSTINTDGHYNQNEVTILTTKPNNSAQSNNNIALGIQSLFNNSSGDKNIGIGNNTLKGNTIGHSNIAIGYQSLLSNTNGSFNTSLGRNTLYRNTTGFNNIAIGFNTMLNNTSGSDNIAVGAAALYNNTSGEQNISIGYQSLFNNSTGNTNLALGGYALNKNSNGKTNISIGYKSLYNNTSGNDNIAIGWKSSSKNTSGFQNLSLGKYALHGNINGGQNIAIGTRSQLFSNNNKNSSFGNESFNNFITNTSSLVSYNTNASLYTTSGNSTILYFPNHTYTLNNDVFVQISSTSSLFNNLANNTIILIRPYHQDSIKLLEILVTTPGVGTISFVEYDYNHIIENSTALGYNSEPTKSNQVMLGDENVTEVKTYGSFVSGTTTYPDYVFEKYYDGHSNLKENYDFLSLKETESYILKHKHLPGVKSIKEVTQNDGRLEINMTETAVKNLEKIEELYLHIIAIDKSKEKLKNQVQEQNNTIIELQNQLDELRNLIKLLKVN